MNVALTSSIDGRLYGVGLFRGVALGLPPAPNGLASEGEQGGEVRVIPRVCGRVHAPSMPERRRVSTCDFLGT
jgi:hypothetical protein